MYLTYSHKPKGMKRPRLTVSYSLTGCKLVSVSHISYYGWRHTAAQLLWSHSGSCFCIILQLTGSVRLQFR